MNRKFYYAFVFEEFLKEIFQFDIQNGYAMVIIIM